MSVSMQASTSAEIVPHPVTRAATMKTAATSSTAPALSTEPRTTAPKPNSYASQAELHQFARPPSSESSKSPRRQLQILEPQARGNRTPTRRNRLTALPDVTSSAEPVIVLDNDDTPPEHLFKQFEPEKGAWE